MEKTILIIEDEDDIRFDLSKALELSGFNILTAPNGSEGVDIARVYKPDLIISDIMMPELDGFGVLKMLQDDESTNTIPFIFLTAKSARCDIREGMELGADDYITKPYDIDELLRAIERRLKKQTLTELKFNQKYEALSASLRRTIPHEIRTPLNIILGLSEFLRKNYDYTTHKDAIEMLGNINESGKRLQRLFENYLFFANLEVNSYNQDEILLMRQKKTLLAEYVLKDIIMYLAGNAGRTNDIELNLEDGGVAISETFFTKAVEEIIDNCFKFSTRGTPIQVTSNVVSNTYQISFLDFGRGMSREQIEKIGAYVQFERKLYEQQGTGLGLSIVQKIIQMHNGKLSIVSELNNYTKVLLELPLCKDKIE